jgi:hypothetical protein
MVIAAGERRHREIDRRKDGEKEKENQGDPQIRLDFKKSKHFRVDP